MRNLREQITELSAGLDRLTNGQHEASSGVAVRELFLEEHGHHLRSIGAIDEEIESHLVRRAEAELDNPSDALLESLGPIPVDPEAQTTWIQGAIILEGRRIGLDLDAEQRAHPSMLGPPHRSADGVPGPVTDPSPIERDPVRAIDWPALDLEL